MPQGSSADQLLNFFIIFSIAVAARPVGSVIFGQISDKIGRAASVKITTIIAAISVIAIAFLPSYEMIGIGATLLLTLCRMLFIMSLAGETDAIKIYVAEKIGKKSRHLASSAVSFSAQVGVLIAACMYHYTLSFEDISWLWRVNFIIGGGLGLLVFCFRNYLQESQYYKGNKAKHSPKDDSLIKIISQNRLKFSLATILSGGLGASYNFWIIFLGTFVGNITCLISKTDAAKNNIILIALYGCASLVSGVLADKISSIYKQIVAALVLSLVVVITMQVLSFYNIFLFPLHIIAVWLVPIYMIPIQIKLQSIFAAEIRVRMCSLSHSIGSMVFSSTIPLFCMFLWKHTEVFASVYMYFIMLLLLMLGGVVYLIKGKYDNMFDA